MSQKQAKIIRKEIQARNREVSDAYRKKAEEIAKRDMNMFKPKPWWVPMPVWIFFLGFFVKLRK